ncbi:MAG: arylsulfatase [Bacteroidota bacterium]
MMNHSKLIAFFAFFLFLFGCKDKQLKKEQTHKNPNIVFILADDLGYGDITAFNKDSKIKTPQLDTMAQQGMIFTDAHTSSAVCTPTRYGIITGRYNWRSTLKEGVLLGASKALIPNSRTTVASLLKEKGYNTAFIGKWHLGWDWALKNPGQEPTTGWQDTTFTNIDYTKPVKNTPNDLGFEYAYGHSGSLDMAPYVYVENGMATEIPEESSVNTGKYSWWRKGPTSKDFVHEDVTPNFFRRGMTYIKESANEENPFFLYLALPSPHTPILPSVEWQGKSGLNPYGDFMMMVDDYVGQLNAAIKKAGIEDNTLVIFTSDNGCSPAAKIEELVEKGHNPSHVFRGHKADIFEGGHRVPFIVKWPEKVKAGSKNSQTICTTDFAATCAAIVGYELKNDEAEDSYNILPLFEKGNWDGEFREATVHHSINGSFAIRKGDWKLILCPGSGGWSYPTPTDKDALKELPKLQLYNLNDDPGETQNLQSSNPQKVEELKSLLTKYVQDGRSTPGETQKNDGDGNIWEQLWWMQESD